MSIMPKVTHNNDTISIQDRNFDQAMTATCNGAAISATGTTATNPIIVQSTNYPQTYPNGQR
jgi:hypothetical protein